MVLQKVKEIIAELLGYSDEDEITGSLSLFDDLEMDGDDFDSLIYQLEDNFDIVFDDDVIDNIECVKDLVNYIKKNIE